MEYLAGFGNSNRDYWLGESLIFRSLSLFFMYNICQDLCRSGVHCRFAFLPLRFMARRLKLPNVNQIITFQQPRSDTMRKVARAQQQRRWEFPYSSAAKYLELLLEYDACQRILAIAKTHFTLSLKVSTFLSVIIISRPYMHPLSQRSYALRLYSDDILRSISEILIYHQYRLITFSTHDRNIINRLFDRFGTIASANAVTITRAGDSGEVQRRQRDI